VSMNFSVHRGPTFGNGECKTQWIDSLKPPTQAIFRPSAMFALSVFRSNLERQRIERANESSAASSRATFLNGGSVVATPPEDVPPPPRFAALE